MVVRTIRPRPPLLRLRGAWGRASEVWKRVPSCPVHHGRRRETRAPYSSAARCGSSSDPSPCSMYLVRIASQWCRSCAPLDHDRARPLPSASLVRPRRSPHRDRDCQRTTRARMIELGQQSAEISGSRVRDRHPAEKPRVRALVLRTGDRPHDHHRRCPRCHGVGQQRIRRPPGRQRFARTGDVPASPGRGSCRAALNTAVQARPAAHAASPALQPPLRPRPRSAPVSASGREA